MMPMMLLRAQSSEEEDSTKSACDFSRVCVCVACVN